MKIALIMYKARHRMTQQTHLQNEAEATVIQSYTTPTPHQPKCRPHRFRNAIPAPVEKQPLPMFESFPIQCIRVCVQHHVDEARHDHVPDLGT